MSALLYKLAAERRGQSPSLALVLVIEMKKDPSKSDLDDDGRRINAFQKQLHYKVGALVVCKTGEESSISVEWYK